MKFFKTVTGVFIGLFAVVSMSHADVLSNFNTGLDGWTIEGNGLLSYDSTGGNPGGFARFTDVAGTSGDGWMIAPSSFLGNWTTYNSTGALSWDHIIINTGDIDSIVKASAIISGPGGTATYTRGDFQTTWTTFAAPISSSYWSINSGSWSSILQNVTSLKIRTEAVWNNGNLDVDGMDNVHLAPEPSTIILLGAGLISLLAYAWQRRDIFRKICTL
jgi:hypothetical protein